MKTRPKHLNDISLIYCLRAQCAACNQDHVVRFARTDKTPIAKVYEENERTMNKTFYIRYKCSHPLMFTRYVERDQLWNIMLDKAVKRSGNG